VIWKNRKIIKTFQEFSHELSFFIINDKHLILKSYNQQVFLTKVNIALKLGRTAPKENLFLGQGLVLWEKLSQIDLTKMTTKWFFHLKSNNAKIAPGNITRETLNWKLGRERKTPSRTFHLLNIFTIFIKI